MTQVLITPTYTGSGSCLHPSVIRIGGGWNGYEYWMSITPYPGVQWENPSILASMDGISWEVPVGLTNPIDDFPGGDAYNSDCELIYDGSTYLYCFWRETNQTTPYEKIFYRRTSDGVAWSSRVEILSSATSSALLSPSILYDGSQFVMYTINGGTLDKRTCVTLDGVWSTATKCSFDLGGKTPYHCQVLLYNNVYWLFLSQYTSDLYYVKSEDGEIFTSPKLFSSVGAFDFCKDKINRATCLGLGDFFYIYYSGLNGTSWRIGLDRKTLS